MRRHANRPRLRAALAAYLTMAGPRSLPVIRTFQAALFREPSLAHVAEVVLSRLMRLNRETDTVPGRTETIYAFLPGVTELLPNTVPARELTQILLRVAAYIRLSSMYVGTTRWPIVSG